MWEHFWQNAWVTLYCVILRPLWKWTLHRFYGQCELLRITYNYSKGAARTKEIEGSLKQSRIAKLKKLTFRDEDVDVDHAVLEVMQIKGISGDMNPKFKTCFKDCLCQICGYSKLTNAIESLRKTKYDSQDKEHEKKLQQLWDALKPDEKLKDRIGEQWKDLGFQGEDPMTDFRGMGILGLDQLLFFAEKHTKLAQTLLSLSNHPQYSYPYAIVGINLTKTCVDLLQTGSLKTHFYNISKEAPSTVQFHEVYCCLFFEFHKFWFGEKPRDIMEFGRLHLKFKMMHMEKLKNNSAILVTDFKLT